MLSHLTLELLELRAWRCADGTGSAHPFTVNPFMLLTNPSWGLRFRVQGSGFRV